MDKPTKTEPNWAAIEIPYRAGLLSVRAIAKAFNVPLTTLQRQARERGWKRADLASRVRQATQERLAQGEPHQGEPKSEPPENGSMQGLEDEESQANSSVGSPSCARAQEDGMDSDFVIAAASRLQADVTMAHRRDMAKATALCKRLLAELSLETDAIEIIEAEIIDATKADRTDTRRRAMMRAVSHATRAQSMRTLTSALAELVRMERQAFNMDADGSDDTATTLEERLKDYARDAAIKGSGGKVVDLANPPPSHLIPTPKPL